MKQNKIIKILLQIVFFIWIPESFSITLFALKTLAVSVVRLRFEHLLDPVLILLGTIVSTVLFGRYYCGYICAFGAMQDLSFDVRGLLSKDKKKYVVPAKADMFLSKIKYIILAVILILAVLGMGIPGELSPWTSFGNLISFVKGGAGIRQVLTAGLGLLLAIAVITAFYFRAFCRYLCPVGAMYSLVSAFSHDRRKKTCGNSGDCCICPYKCGKYRIHYPGLIAAVLIFIGTNLFLANIYNRPAETQTEEMAEEAAAEETTAEAAAEETTAEAAEETKESTEEAAVATTAPLEDFPEEELTEAGPFTDGTYEGIGTGYRGEIVVSVVVENGYIASVEVLEHEDDESYFRSVKHTLIEEILETQSVDVDAVSGATYSSDGLIEAVKRALDLYESPGDDALADSGSTAEEEPEETAEGTENEPEEDAEKTTGSIELDLSHLEDGVYEGSGIGFRGEIEVAVTVSNHAVESIRILSYYDNEEYLFYVSQKVIDEVVNREPLDVDAVSGATYSCNGLTRAIADALQVDEDTFVLPEASPRKMKDKESHHVTKKYIESDEQYQELVEKYAELMYGADGKKKE